MAGVSVNPQYWILAVGILGNMISLAVFLVPLVTFYKVYKKKSTEGFQSIPYVVSLFSCSLWVYYALIKADNSTLLITINAFGCFIESLYVIMFIIYAPKDAKKFTMLMVGLFNFGLYGLILLLTFILAKGTQRSVIVGWICVGFSASVFAAPLSVIRKVIKTKSVEYMPFPLSLTLTLTAIVWFAYGFLIKDKYVAIPNILGFFFGMLQMVIYTFYKLREVRDVTVEMMAQEEHVITMATKEGYEIDYRETATMEQEV